MLEVFDAARHAQPSVGTYSSIVQIKLRICAWDRCSSGRDETLKEPDTLEESDVWKLWKAEVCEMIVFPSLA